MRSKSSASPATRDGVQETRQDFTANDFRITRALDSLLISAKSIKGDEISSEDIAARLRTLRHLLKQVGHDV
jgi:Arc/MetJ-type ribon-helix-helix transcriptional regulator